MEFPSGFFLRKEGTIILIQTFCLLNPNRKLKLNVEMVIRAA